MKPLYHSEPKVTLMKEQLDEIQNIKDWKKFAAQHAPFEAMYNKSEDHNHSKIFVALCNLQLTIQIIYNIWSPYRDTTYADEKELKNLEDELKRKFKKLDLEYKGDLVETLERCQEYFKLIGTEHIDIFNLVVPKRQAKNSKTVK